MSGIKLAKIADKGVSINYKGSATLTISPPASGNVTQLQPGDTVKFEPSYDAYTLTFGTDTIASVHYPMDGASVKITGGSYHSGAGPLYFVAQVDTKSA